MPFLEMAKSIVCSIIAVALAMTVAAVEALLPSRPDWLERVNDLALQLRTVSEEPRRPAGRARSTAPAAEEPTAGEERPGLDTERLLLAYNQLWQFVHGIRSDGLSLDDRFCERVEREWTVSTLLSYMRNADRSLQDKAGRTLETASTYLAAAAAERGKPS
jgi:hypothetical protein